MKHWLEMAAGPISLPVAPRRTYQHGMIPRCGAPMRFYSCLLVLLAVVLSGGCSRGRTPRSVFVPLPVDQETIEARAAVASMMSSEELKLSRPREYYIGPGDVLGITLVGRPDILGTGKDGTERMTITVTENPIITLPLIGAITVHGKTSIQIEEQLKTAYTQFISNPVPVVVIEKYYYNQVNVLGSIRKPGSYPLDFGDTVVDAVFKAGGLSFGRETGGLPPARFLKVYREKVNNRERNEMTADQYLEKIREGEKILPREEIIIPIEEFILNGDLQYNIPLYPNDIVFIPGAGTVIVHGRIKNPGVVFLGPSVRTLLQVVTERGRLRYSGGSIVEVVRSYPDGRQESFFHNVRRIQLRKDEDFYMMDGDQVFVYTIPTRDFLEFMGNIFRISANTGLSPSTYAPI
jgi:protein involved in polysaccharide export with SLBB domain